MENEKIIELVRKSAFWIDPEHPQIIYLNTNTLKDDLEQIRKDAVKQDEKVCDCGEPLLYDKKHNVWFCPSYVCEKIEQTEHETD